MLLPLLMMVLGFVCGFSYSSNGRLALFDKYIQDFQLGEEISKVNDIGEYNRRLNVFNDNMDSIESFNAQQDNSVVLGITKFTHWTETEFSTWVQRGVRSSSISTTLPSFPPPASHHHDYPDTLDWTERGAVTPVKNQGRCGDCWSFSVAAAMESAYFVKYGTLPGTYDPNTGFTGLSEMQLTSCDMLSYGCNGGYPVSGYMYAAQYGGLSGEGSYPFTAENFTTGYVGGANEHCYHHNITNIEGTATDPENPYFAVEPTVDAFMSALQEQPLSIQIAASKNIFQFYTSGVIKNTDRYGNRLPKKNQCGNKLDHAVLLVGYGTQDGVDYWKVKNSWAASWGMDGYVLIERSRENVCGVLTGGTYPNLLPKAGAPTTMPTMLEHPAHEKLYVLDEKLGKEAASTGLDFEADFPQEVELLSAKFSGNVFSDIGSVDAIACLSSVHEQTHEASTWVLGAVGGSSTYVTYVSLRKDRPNFRTANSLVGAFLPSRPWMIPGYNLEMSCKNLIQYEQTYANPNNFTLTLSYDDLEVDDLVYFVIRGRVDQRDRDKIGGATLVEYSTSQGESESTIFISCIFVLVVIFLGLHNIWFLRRFHKADRSAQYVLVGIGMNDGQQEEGEELYEIKATIASCQYGTDL